MTLPNARAALAAALAALLSAVAIVVVVTIGEDPEHPGHQRTTVTVTLGAPAKASAKVPDRMRVPAPAVAQVAASDAGGHDQARDESPVGVSPAELEAGRQKLDELAAIDQLPVAAPDAAPSQVGCRSRFVSSYSSRRGVAPHLIVLHYTVSPNLAGWGDVDGNTAFFARAATQASAHYVIDREGHCNYIVREVDKAWTQAAANPFAIGIEVVNSGREANLTSGAGMTQLARVVHDAAKRWRIPLRAGAVASCAPARYGVVTHQMLGACGGGHVDISPYNADLARVITAAKALDRPKTVGSSVDRATCRKLTWWRENGRPNGKPAANAVRRRKALDARHLVCTAKGVRRA